MAQPGGTSTGEIVATYGVSRRLVPKYIGILEDAGVPVYEDNKRYYLSDGYSNSFTLSTVESEFLYLILERSLTLHGERWHTLKRLVNKLSSKLVAPLDDYLSTRLDRDASESLSDVHFRLLAQAKRKQMEVLVEYHALNREQATIWRIRPFRFVSNYFSDGLYIACYGKREHEQEDFVPLTLRLDRILDLDIQKERFGTLEQARFSSIEGQAWGVWHSEKEAVRVVLRFEPRHYDRLIETTWHPTQDILADKDGYVQFSVEVSEPQEMVPWIRSWGSGVVVLEPPALRERIFNTLRRQLQAYGFQNGMVQADKPIHYLWAKYDRVSEAYHVLHYHLMDVAAVAWQMWHLVLSSSHRQWLRQMLRTDDDNAAAILALLAGLHDIGKATPCFQKKVLPLYEALLSMGIQDERAFEEPHGILSAVILPNLLDQLGIEARPAQAIAAVIGGHHGEWISRAEQRNARASVGREQWAIMQETLFSMLSELLGVKQIQLPDDEMQCNAFCTFLSGFVSVCDWIGSDETFFPYESAVFEADLYFTRAIEQAQQALHETGWLSWQPAQQAMSFEQMFAFAPNAMQQTLINAIDLTQGPPRLILIEYLTGGGKTEAALYLADQLINVFAQSGIYVAMPTQATSNQMFGRMARYLKMRYADQPVNMQLIHSQAHLNAAFREIEVQPDREGNESNLVAATWFQNRKRALLAPFAVGTIDQAMLAVLQARHHFVRQYALSHKTIVFDEIHSYDAYMNEIIERLLMWLHTLQSTAILLSATLARSTRERLLAQVGASEMPSEVRYPRLTIVDAHGGVSVLPLPAPSTRTLHLQFEASDTLVDWLLPIYQAGGCIAIVCNTVDEAIAVMHQLMQTPEINQSDIMLFHARNVPAWRSDIENTVLRRFGKTGKRPKRMILVATQIIEQSLDLDFDLMITRVAPIDLLIQRAGRLHRHPHHERPAHLQTPKLIIQKPAFDEQGIPDFGVDGVIYARYILLRTWHILRDRQILQLPDDTDALMDAVYRVFNSQTMTGDSHFDQALAEAHDDMTMGQRGQTFRGAQYCINEPASEFLIGANKSFDLSDDEEKRIATRDISPGIDIICLTDTPDSDSLPIYLDRKPTRDEVNELVLYRITVRKRAMLEALDRLPEHPKWQRVPQLQQARPVVFHHGNYHIPNSSYRLRLSPDFGLEIIEEQDV